MTGATATYRFVPSQVLDVFRAFALFILDIAVKVLVLGVLFKRPKPMNGDPEGFSLLGKLLIALGVVGAVLLTPIWTARSWVEKRLAAKADKETVDNHRKDIKELFCRIDGLKDDMNVRIVDLKDDMNQKHVALLQAIHATRKGD